MARARNIKPGFFQNEELSELDPIDRLFFIGLWTVCDFKGCLEYRPKRLKVQILPYDDACVEEIAINLERSRFIRIYSVQGRNYIKVVNFGRHQNPHKNERAKGSEIPDIDDEDAQVIDSKGLAINPDKIGTSPDKIGSARADSLNLIPDSLSPDSLKLNPEEKHICDLAAPKSPKRNSVPVQEIVDLYHELLPELPKVAKITDARKGYIQQRWREDLKELDHWRNFFNFVRRSDFLMGRTESTNGRKPFRADLEWLTRPSNFAKVAEDKYHGTIHGAH